MKDRLNNYLDKFYTVVEKVGKQNVILIVFIFFIILITGLYQTFSLSTQSEGLSIVDGLKTYKFVLANNEENSVTIAANSSKNLLITVSNSDELDLKYGIYYTSSDDLKNVNLGYLSSSVYKASGIIPPKSDYIVTTRIDNNSDEDVTITFGTKYGFETGGNLTLDPNHFWLQSYYAYLNTLEDIEGSYVKYIGNNGCSGMACQGQNANYVNDSDMGYCHTTDSKYTVNGWRVAYVKDNSTYLVSAGAPECLSTDSTGTSSSESLDNHETTEGVPLHLVNLNSATSKYCNAAFASFNDCSIATRSINADDFYQITGSILSSVSCFETTSEECGSNNDLIAIGGNYWFANAYDIDTLDNDDNIFSSALYRNIAQIANDYTNHNNGVRPVIQLDSSIVVIDGSGTYKDPYIIENLNTIKDLSGNMNNGVLVGPTWNKEDGTVTTDGVDDYINCGMVARDFEKNISMVIRVKFNDLETNTDKIIFGNQQEGGGAFIVDENDKLYFTLYIDGVYQRYQSTITVSEDKWYTIVGTYNGSNMLFYVNGKLAENDNSNTSISGTIRTSSIPFYIGGNPESLENTKASAMTVSDVLVFERALTEKEIESNYNTEIDSINEEGLLLHYDFYGEKHSN